MRKRKLELTLVGLATVLSACAGVAQAGSDEDNYGAQGDNVEHFGHAKHESSVQVGRARTISCRAWTPAS